MKPEMTEAQPPEILIVDDDRSVIMMLHKVLPELGRIRFASSAEQAWSMITVSPPDLILMDIELADLSGLHLCQILKADPESENIPVLFITSHTEPGFEERVFDAGGVDYIPKPLNPRVVASRVATHLGYRKALKRVDEMASHDELTRCANRRRFNEALLQEWQRATRQKQPLSVLMFDIDEFKKYNDHFGHMAGDRCIQDVAKILGSGARGPGELVARYGGEEFAIILPATDAAAAKERASALRLAVEKMRIRQAPAGSLAYVTVSVGCSTLVPGQAESGVQSDMLLVEAADRALSEAKRGGRNRVSVSAVESQSAQG